ncbi:MAG TPA: rod shape-determining protein MreD [Aliiroseovarius sp.]|nr:rod shape-determining protein MreD [Aliiroseovarius sp.]
MIDPITFRTWFYRVLLVILVALITFVYMLPISTLPASFPGPDLPLALVYAWVMRRPEYVPALLVAVLFFLIGILAQEPPGLRPALILIGLEYLRGRAQATTDRPFAMEWGMVFAVMAAILLAERVVLTVLLVEQVSFGKSVLRLLVTGAAYPVVVAISVYLFRVRRALPGEADALRSGL